MRKTEVERLLELSQREFVGDVMPLVVLRTDLPALACFCMEAMETLRNLIPFREHHSGCEIDHTDFCSCGLIIPAATAATLLRAYDGHGEGGV